MRFMFVSAVAAAMLGAVAAHAQTAAPATDPRFLAPATGSWTYAPVAGGSDAVFVDSTGQAQLIVRCNRALRQVSIARPASAPAAALAIYTTDQARNVPATFDPATRQVRANLAANDRLLDSMMFSRGRVAVAIAGMVPISVPVWPEPARAIEDCRN